MSLTCKEIYLYIDKELAGKGIPIEAKNWNIKNKKRSRVSKNWSSSIYVKRYRHRF
mgnify:CR=1 FL=1